MIHVLLLIEKMCLCALGSVFNRSFRRETEVMVQFFSGVTCLCILGLFVAAGSYGTYIRERVLAHPFQIVDYQYIGYVFS